MAESQDAVPCKPAAPGARQPAVADLDLHALRRDRDRVGRDLG
jgi:hypothetical protein